MKMGIKSIINRVLELSGYQVVKIENSSGFRDFVSSRNLEAARGVLHIRAHFGEKRFVYSKLAKPVMWIEAVPEYFEKLVSNISGFEKQQAHQLLLSD
jgi:hypothetical protein